MTNDATESMVLNCFSPKQILTGSEMKLGPEYGLKYGLNFMEIGQDSFFFASISQTGTTSSTYVDSGKLQEIDSNEVEYYNISLQILEMNVLSQVVNG